MAGYRGATNLTDTNKNGASIPVIIVGGGPIGLMLALFLDLYGVRSVLFNTEETTRWHPKGSSEGPRTMEHFRRLGVADEIRKLGLPADHPTDVAYFTRFGGAELARLLDDRHTGSALWRNAYGLCSSHQSV